MWQTLTGENVFVPSGGLQKLIPQLKRTSHLWYAAMQQFQGNLRLTLLRLLGLLAKRATLRHEQQAPDGINLLLFVAKFGERDYELWTRPNGAIIAIRPAASSFEFEFEHDPGPSANNVHEQVIGYLHGLFDRQGYEVRVDKDLGHKVGSSWKSIAKLRPDLQVTDKQGNTYYIEDDSSEGNGLDHRSEIKKRLPNSKTILIGYDHSSGKPTFKTKLDDKGAPSQIHDLLKHIQGQNWKVVDMYKAMQNAKVGNAKAVAHPKRRREIAAFRQSRSNRPPNIGGAVRRTPRGGRHRESEHFSELAI